MDAMRDDSALPANLPATDKSKTWLYFWIMIAGLVWFLVIGFGEMYLYDEGYRRTSCIVCYLLMAGVIAMATGVIGMLLQWKVD